MSRVVVTELEYRKARAAFGAAARDGLECTPAPEAESELAAAVAERAARHAIVGVAPYSDALYRALPRGGVLARFGIGHDNIDKARATEAGLLCTNTPGVLDDSVAEHAVALMLAAARHIPRLAERTRSGSWAPEVGLELRGKTLAVIGCGSIGCRVARIASAGLGMRVVGCKRRPVGQAEMRREYGFERIELDFAAAVAEADFVSLHIPSTPATRHFLSAARLAQVPARAWVINTARGTLVDEMALYDALASGSLAGAALDVVADEPYAPADPARDLRALPNVVMTPHVASSTREACARMAERALRNVLLAERGDYAEMDLLNPAVLPTLG